MKVEKHDFIRVFVAFVNVNRYGQMWSLQACLFP